VVVDQIDERDHAANEYERMGQLDRANLLRDASLCAAVAHCPLTDDRRPAFDDA
jgi:hypothetical protein